MSPLGFKHMIPLYIYIYIYIYIHIYKPSDKVPQPRLAQVFGLRTFDVPLGVT